MLKSTYLFFALAVLIISNNALGQKLKYKDIFSVVDAKNYDEGLSKLNTFLNDPKNSQMGLYYEGIVDKLHLINDSTFVLKAADSAFFFLTKAKDLINEKELKKNDDYYQSYYRRDLRTGDFGIKLSDVHLDIEKKLKNMEAIQKYGKGIFSNLYSVHSCNSYLFGAYQSLFRQYKSYNDLLLMVTSAQIDTLNEMADKENIMKDAFSDMRRAVGKIGKKGYSPELSFSAIETYGVDGLSEVDVFSNDVNAWEYGEWAYKTSKEIKESISELKSQLEAFNQKLKDENEKLKGLETIEFESLTHEIDPYIVEKLAELDSDPLPVVLYTILIKKNEYDFMTNPERNSMIGEKDNVDFQVMFTDSLVSVLGELEKDVSKLEEEYVLDGKKKYTDFLNNGYGGDFGVLKFRKAYEEFLTNSKQNWIYENREYLERSKWGISEDESDTLYLNIQVDSLYKNNVTGNNYSVATYKDDDHNTFVVGIDMVDQTKGFMAMVSNARKIVWKETFKLGGFKFNRSTELVSGKFIPSQEGKLTAYIYVITPEGQKKATNLVVINADQVGQISWVNEITAKIEPVEAKFNELVKETVLYMMTEEEMDQAGPNDKPYYVIDRSGKVR